MYLKVALGVSAYGANFRSLGANNDVAAVTAFPNLNFALLENLSGFDVLQKGTITLYMMLLDFANHAELGRQSLEALFFCGLGEVIVHIGPLVVFAISCSCEVCCGVTDAAELLECWEVLSHSYDDNTKHYEADTKFHEILANATHNVVIKKLFPIIQEGIRQFLSETSSLHTDETSRLHYEVMKAVITHDAAKARETMQLLICTNQDLLGW